MIKLVLVSLLLYGVNVGIINNYLWSPLFSEYLWDSPYAMLAILLMGFILYILIVGRAALDKFGSLCLGILFSAMAVILVRLLLVQAAHLLRDISHAGGLTWSYALAYAISIWLYGYTFGWMICIVGKNNMFQEGKRFKGWRLIWFAFCLLTAILYQKSADSFPHTRLMDYQSELSLLVYIFAPMMGVFLEIQQFRASYLSQKNPPPQNAEAS